MNPQNYIVRFRGLSVRDEGKLRKIQGEIDALNFLNVLDNASNPEGSINEVSLLP